MDLYVQDATGLCGRILTSTGKERMRLISELMMTAYLGGDSVPNYIATTPIPKLLVTMVRDQAEPLPVRVKVLQAISGLVRASRALQDILRREGFIEFLAEQVGSEVEDVRRWAALSLMFMLHGNVANQTTALTIPGLSEKLAKASNDNWRTWSYNDALEVSKILHLEQQM
jgi:hypothetical protein